MQAQFFSFGEKQIADLRLSHNVEVNPSMGSVNTSVPIPLTKGRRDFGPSLALSYGTSGGNSPYGVGWSLDGIPSIAVDTRKELAKHDGTDRFTLGGSELVPKVDDVGGEWIPRVENRGQFRVHSYRQRFEGAFARIEQWVQQATGRIHWRVRDRENRLTVFGFADSGNSRIESPKEDHQTIAWLAETQLDGYGNVIQYEYAAEDEREVNGEVPFERHRRGANFPTAQRYIKHIRYGNETAAHTLEEVPNIRGWLFHIAFDYGDHDELSPGPTPSQAWATRQDPFSSFRSGFEIRTHRLCRRILIFHSRALFNTNNGVLVGSLNLTHAEDPSGTTLSAISYTGHRNDNGEVTERSLPPLKFRYTQPSVDDSFQVVGRQSVENIPNGLNDVRYRWVDLFGEGIPGVLCETQQAWYYKPNLGQGVLGPQVNVADRPSHISGTYSLSDFDADGNPNLVVLDGQQAGYFEFNRDHESWNGFRPFPLSPRLGGDGRQQWLDLNGDGRTDVVVECQDRLTWFQSRGRDGFEDPIEIAKPDSDSATLTKTISENSQLGLFFADMTGDGSLDLVQVQNGRVRYWPQIGRGTFGDEVLMDQPPFLDAEFDTRRVRLVDLDGSGTADLVYIGAGEITYWSNASGNALVDEGVLSETPFIDDISSATIVDFLGDGTPCLVWSTPLASHSQAPIQFLQLTSGVKPRLLLSVDNSMGQVTNLVYSTSGTHYLRDKQSTRPWITKLPNHQTVVDEIELIDHIGGTRSVSQFEYHDGYFDGEERLFRGFGLVDQYDTEFLQDIGDANEIDYTPPVCVRTWSHNGSIEGERLRQQDYYDGDSRQATVSPLVFEDGTPTLDSKEFTDAYRSIAGRPVRQEVFAVNDDGTRHEHPFTVTQIGYAVRQVQPAREEDAGSYLAFERETLSYAYDQIADDPRISHSFNLIVDPVGKVTEQCEIAYPRRDLPDRLAEQDRLLVRADRFEFTSIDEPDAFFADIPVHERRYEIVNIRPDEKVFGWLEARDDVLSSFIESREFEEPFFGAAAQARLLQWQQHYYWDASQTGVLPIGQAASPVLPHHSEQACFNDDYVASVYGIRVQPTMLSTDADLVSHHGYWWQRGDTSHNLAAERFFGLERTEHANGSSTRYSFDEHDLALVGVTDQLGHAERAVIDYHVLAPQRITDINENVGEVRYDPLGVPVVATSHGQILAADGVTAADHGNQALEQYVLQQGHSVEDVLSNPHQFLQGASQFYEYEFGDWGQIPLPAAPVPPRGVTLVRESLVNDGTGIPNPVDDSRIQTALTYIDGFGRPLQSKLHVEAGLAIVRDNSNQVILDADGVPVLESSDTRWLVSGHTVYDNKQQPVREYEPYFSTTHDFESDAVLRSIGVRAQLFYDAVGRIRQTEFPDGTRTRVEYAAWSTNNFDQNDTVNETIEPGGYLAERQTLPNDDPEREALAKAQAHADTPTTVHVDPLGREVLFVEPINDTQQRTTRTEFDAGDNVRAITDPRLLTAFVYRHDMLGRILQEQSVDAGDRWTLFDSFDNPIHTWDSRDVHVQTELDDLRRPSRQFVDGLGLNQVTERFEYGDDPLLPNAQLRNVRGQPVTHFDQAGTLRFDQYSPAGELMRSVRQLTQEFRSEPDWSNPATVLLEPDQYATQLQFDAMGRIVSKTLADGTQHDYEFQRSGGVRRVRVTTDDGELDQQEFVSESLFNARGQREMILFGNGVRTNVEFNRQNHRMDRLLSTRPDPANSGARQTLQDIRYTYDPVGNITRTVDEAQQVGGTTHVLQGLSVSSHSDFTYDALYRLTQANGRVHQALAQHDYRPNQSVADTVMGTRHLSLNNGAAVERYRRNYQYDLAGNIQSVQHIASQSWTTTHWISDSSNRSLPDSDPLGNAILNPETRFDANGNTTFLPHLSSLAWNYRNNISQATIIERTAQPNDVEFYVYGGNGMRVRKVTERLVRTDTQAVETTEKIYLDGCEIKRIRTGGTTVLERSTTHIDDGEDRISLLHQWSIDQFSRETNDVSVKRIHYQLSDHLGSSSIEVNQTAEVVSYEEYFPYGGTAFIAGNLSEVRLKDYRYSGKESDANTGLYYFGFRYFAPWTGNWMCPDPIGPEDSQNLYEYVQRNPVRFSDPVGLTASNRTTDETDAQIVVSIYPSEEGGQHVDTFVFGEIDEAEVNRFVSSVKAYADVHGLDTYWDSVTVTLPFGEGDLERSVTFEIDSKLSEYAHSIQESPPVDTHSTKVEHPNAPEEESDTDLSAHKNNGNKSGTDYDSVQQAFNEQFRELVSEHMEQETGRSVCLTSEAMWKAVMNSPDLQEKVLKLVQSQPLEFKANLERRATLEREKFFERLSQPRMSSTTQAEIDRQEKAERIRRLEFQRFEQGRTGGVFAIGAQGWGRAFADRMEFSEENKLRAQLGAGGLGIALTAAGNARPGSLSANLGIPPKPNPTLPGGKSTFELQTQPSSSQNNIAPKPLPRAPQQKALPPAESSVVRNDATPKEARFLELIARQRSGRFVGPVGKKVAGKDGYVDGVPIQLKQTEGRSPRNVSKYVVRSAVKAKNAGLLGVEVFVEAPNVRTEALISGPIRSILNTYGRYLNSVTVFASDGVVVFVKTRLSVTVIRVEKSK